MFALQGDECSKKYKMIRLKIKLLLLGLLSSLFAWAVSLPSSEYRTSEDIMSGTSLILMSETDNWLLGEGVEDPDDDWTGGQGEPGSEPTEEEDDDWDDHMGEIGDTPIGDAILPLTLLLVGYGLRRVYLLRKKK